ncbi:MAG TPA: hypothetical protein VKB35_03395 [Ktedonobacteraceae bacterium]|nr:hypothetical protein [Ktedonobacteraceae bacterium]
MVALIIGLAACIFTISILLIGWYFLRQKLLPVSASKLPSSGAGPWSRVRTDPLPGNAYANGAFQYVGSSGGVPTNPPSWEPGAVTSTWTPVPDSGWSAPALNIGTLAQPTSTTGSLAPTNDGNFAANSDFTPTTGPSNASTTPTAFVAQADNYGQFPFTSPASYAWTTDAAAKPLSGKRVRLQAMSPSDSQAGAYDEPNPSQAGSDLNDLREMIRQYRQKDQEVQEQEGEAR